jgi:hypothetical protein
MNASAAQTEPAMSPEILALQGESLQPTGRIVLELVIPYRHKPDKTVADYVAQAGGTR